MKVSCENIRNEMEYQRQVLYRLADEYGFLDQRVLLQSQKLDQWLNEYERQKK
ncbi:aspartyl-phosphate phosphatase Spo0E family protein [Saccharibacillus kuerlensis]|uniref:Spo0E like sporulation regulatory protein n=1 Tax=Saccharibacillus kuerlensis TaxID=459527 RepID=A0ABQ2KZH4_9BACL|nr:aspartyl-phosphate phosphatase Spo0E family protein [Saccharibacillus kuerlensis]GGN97750.1 hypothetical protein GCM10010969_15950 [Saccharibacillus kuerlensis]